ncbi:MAG: hypothetical protein R6W06_09195 [Prochlorococcaceae cyanobacterium]
MAYYRAQLPFQADNHDVHRHLAGHLQAIGLAVEPGLRGKSGLLATEPPSRQIGSREHVIVHCDWSEHAISGVVDIECRSDESMARRQTHCREVFEAVCLRLLPDLDEGKQQAA